MFLLIVTKVNIFEIKVHFLAHFDFCLANVFFLLFVECPRRLQFVKLLLGLCDSIIEGFQPGQFFGRCV